MDIGKISVFGAVFLASHAAFAQDTQQAKRQEAWITGVKVEIVGSLALGHIFRFEDRGFGDGANLGIGVELPVRRRLRFNAELNHTFGLKPDQVQCGAIAYVPGEPLPCVGSARTGVSAATAASFTAAYYFGRGRVQPYVLGGISILWTRSVSSTQIVYPDRVEMSERSSNDTGAGLTLGAGLRAAITRRLSIRPEIRLSDGTALSSAKRHQGLEKSLRDNTREIHLELL